MFAHECDEDFMAGYDHAKRAGVVHVADHHVVPGKKLWQWGPSEQGRMWDHILTDEDGPYIELMIGAYQDNQPDYGWIQPYPNGPMYEEYPLRKTLLTIRGVPGVGQNAS